MRRRRGKKSGRLDCSTTSGSSSYKPYLGCFLLAGHCRNQRSQLGVLALSDLPEVHADLSARYHLGHRYSVLSVGRHCVHGCLGKEVVVSVS